MGRRGKNTARLNRIETFRGKSLVTLISAATSGSVAVDGNGLNGTGASRFGNLTDNFSEFRVTAMEIEFFSGSGGGLGNCAVGYVQGPSDSPPTSIGNTILCECSKMSWGSTTNSVTLKIPRSVLVEQSSMKWWKSRPGTTGSDWDEVQGIIVACCAVAGTLQAVITWEVECTGFIATSSTPLPRPIGLKEDPLVVAARLILADGNRGTRVSSDVGLSPRRSGLPSSSPGTPPEVR